MSLNKAMLIGRLTRDPEMRYTPGGAPVTNFSIATNSFTGSGEERKEKVEYHNLVAWNMGNRKLAEILGEHLKKGQMVYVEGRLQTRSWEQDGVKRYSTEVVVTDFEFLSSKDGSGGGRSTPRQADPAESEEAPRDVDPDDIPF
jgi:single-strand DNA-binding protein